MKKIYTFFIIVLLSLSTTYATTTTSSSSWYPEPILDSSLKFEAKLDWSKVYTSWSVYNKDEWFVYYKVVRSADNANPVYPDNWYIKYTTDVNETSYIDASPLNWTNYYRVCAITSEKNRYCSNVVKIYKETLVWSDKDEHGCIGSAWYTWCEVKNKCLRTWEEKCEKPEEKPVACTMEYAPVCWKKESIQKTYSNKCMLNAEKATYLYSWECKDTNTEWVTNTDTKTKIYEYNIKIKAEKLVNSFIQKVEKTYSDTEKRISIINTVIEKLSKLSETKPNQKQLIEFIISKLKTKIESYKSSDLGDIESIFNEIQ
jgi:hypothetical protein